MPEKREMERRDKVLEEEDSKGLSLLLPPFSSPLVSELSSLFSFISPSNSYIVYPRNPDFVDWSLHFPAFFSSPSSSPPPLSSSFQEREKDSQSLRHSQERHDGRRSSPLYLNTDQYPVSYPRRQPSYLNGSSAGGGASSLHRVEFVDVGCGYGGLLGKKDSNTSLLPRSFSLFLSFSPPL
ncbi:trna (guanine-n -)-methyltransferase [Cystoisospora suis]|uniref:Trna (Guanine-n-)-methyltransferase n=1 Tax=Cystoisospora suis TaxID=483139 RepID=A0A2C6KKV7_9APIC|nr:trna (guanine-n -)-methyltransferase [Cystoisospora suis]